MFGSIPFDLERKVFCLPGALNDAKILTVVFMEEK